MVKDEENKKAQDLTEKVSGRPLTRALEKSEGGMELDEENHQVQHLIEKVFTSRQIAEIHPTTNIQTDRQTD